MVASRVISANEEIHSLFEDAARILKSRKVTCASYRIVEPFHSQLSQTAVLFHFGFPDPWVELYDGSISFRKSDPIADFVMKDGRPMSWKGAINAQVLSIDQLYFVEQMEAHGLVNGYAVPLFGVGGREAYSTFAFGNDEIDLRNPAVLEVINLLSQLHQNVAGILNEKGREAIRLSDRECEVLRWIAMGKSNQDIATILGLAPPTVATYTKRVFKKLDVYDRRTATLKAIEFGIFRF